MTLRRKEGVIRFRVSRKFRVESKQGRHLVREKVRCLGYLGCLDPRSGLR